MPPHRKERSKRRHSNRLKKLLLQLKLRPQQQHQMVMHKPQKRLKLRLRRKPLPRVKPLRSSRNRSDFVFARKKRQKRINL